MTDKLIDRNITMGLPRRFGGVVNPAILYFDQKDLPAEESQVLAVISGLPASGRLEELEKQNPMFSERLEMAKKMVKAWNILNQIEKGVGSQVSAIPMEEFFAAIEPFAKIPFEDFSPRVRPDNEELMGWNNHTVRVGDVRRIRALLDKLRGG